MSNTLTQLLKVGCIVKLFILVIAIFFISFGIDMYLISTNRSPYFFDPDRIESYDEPIFSDIDEKLIEYYESNRGAILALQRDLIYLPDNRSLKVEFKQGNEVSISASYKGGSFYKSHFNYRSAESEEYMRKIKVSPEQLDRIKDKLNKAGCFSFKKEKGMRLGVMKAKSGTFYYRFNNANHQETLQDSCLIMKIDDQVYLEYQGFGRGPDCKQSENPNGYDSRNLFLKWLDLILNGKEVFEERK
ncbi:MAG: hypothetical protein AAGA77_10660 [Bacteroidota bacterium]